MSARDGEFVVRPSADGARERVARAIIAGALVLMCACGSETTDPPAPPATTTAGAPSVAEPAVVPAAPPVIPWLADADRFARVEIPQTDWRLAPEVVPPPTWDERRDGVEEEPAEEWTEIHFGAPSPPGLGLALAALGERTCGSRFCCVPTVVTARLAWARCQDDEGNAVLQAGFVAEGESLTQFALDEVFREGFDPAARLHDRCVADDPLDCVVDAGMVGISAYELRAYGEDDVIAAIAWPELADVVRPDGPLAALFPSPDDPPPTEAHAWRSSAELAWSELWNFVDEPRFVVRSGGGLRAGVADDRSAGLLWPWEPAPERHVIDDQIATVHRVHLVRPIASVATDEDGSGLVSPTGGWLIAFHGHHGGYRSGPDEPGTYVMAIDTFEGHLLTSDAVAPGHPGCPESRGVPREVSRSFPRGLLLEPNVATLEARRGGALVPVTVAWSRVRSASRELSAYVRVLPRDGCAVTGAPMVSLDVPADLRALEIATPPGEGDSVLILATRRRDDVVAHWEVRSLDGAVLWSGGLRSSYRVPEAERVVATLGGEPAGTLLIGRVGTDEVRVSLGTDGVTVTGNADLVVPEAVPAAAPDVAPPPSE